MKLNYTQAKKIVADYKHLIGKEYGAGGRIDQIVIVPANLEQWKAFLKVYDQRTKNQEEAILPFINGALTIHLLHIMDESKGTFSDFFQFVKEYDIEFNPSKYP